MKGQLATIFVVEDDDVDYRLLRRAFDERKIGNVVVRARDGIDALEQLRSGAVRKPYIILLDINMPRMNGREFLAELRKDPELHQSVVFAVTTSDDERDVRQVFEHHVAGYFLKDNVYQSLEEIVGVVDGYWQIVVLPR